MTEKTLTHEELCAIWEAAYIVEREKKMNKQTNEEWFCNLSTEEKAEWLFKHMDCTSCPANQKKCHMYYGNCKKVIMEWLKQPHTDKE